MAAGAWSVRHTGTPQSTAAHEFHWPLLQPGNAHLDRRRRSPDVAAASHRHTRSDLDHQRLKRAAQRLVDTTAASYRGDAVYLARARYAGEPFPLVGDRITDSIRVYRIPADRSPT